MDDSIRTGKDRIPPGPVHDREMAQETREAHQVRRRAKELGLKLDG
jgi:hypothetical protein